MFNNSDEDSVINVAVAADILVTLFFLVALSEISFSKLTQNYLRKTVSQEKLSGHATISVENKVVMKLKFKKVLNDFVTMKAPVCSLYNTI
jgi:hypothetical protein